MVNVTNVHLISDKMYVRFVKASTVLLDQIELA